MKENAKSWGLDWPLYEQKQLLPESNALTSSKIGSVFNLPS
jgi:hypothetical protein